MFQHEINGFDVQKQTLRTDIEMDEDGNRKELDMKQKEHDKEINDLNRETQDILQNAL